MNEQDLLTLVGWLGGLALMLWRPADGSRLPWAACVGGAAIWCALPLWEPATGALWHFGLTATFLVRGLVRASQPAFGD